MTLEDLSDWMDAVIEATERERDAIERESRK